MNPQPPNSILPFQFAPNTQRVKTLNTPRRRRRRRSSRKELKSELRMAKSLLLIFAVAVLSVSCFLAVEAGVEFGTDLGWLAPTRSGGCDGSMAECGLEGEFEMDSEINRRILATHRYISYAALNKNSVPCSRRGASYYNCRPGASSNPYRRGCSAITRCRS